MPKETLHRTYVYNAQGHAVSGHITRPFDQVIAVQAGMSLPTIGGYGSARVDDFHCHQFVSFRSGETTVSGSRNDVDGSYTTLVTATVVGLNVHDVVTADLLVTRIACNQNLGEPEPRITVLGSKIEGLTIAGCNIDVEFDHQLFLRLNTFEALRKELIQRRIPQNG